METVELGTLRNDETFVLPWRPKGSRAGRVVRQGIGSVEVHVKTESGWEYIAYAKSTCVVRCHPDEYTSQGGTADGASRVINRSKIENPVQVVWDLCTEYIGRGRKPTTEQRNEVVEAAVARGINKHTALTQFYAWRRKG